MSKRQALRAREMSRKLGIFFNLFTLIFFHLNRMKSFSDWMEQHIAYYTFPESQRSSKISAREEEI
jgi:hypothetical protein